MAALSPTNDHGRRHPSTVSLILASAACSSPTASIADLWPSPLGLHSSASHPAARAGAVSRPLLPRIQSISYSGQVFTAPLGDIQLSSHVSCSCLGLTRRDFCNRSEALHPLRSTAKSEITVSRPRHQNEAQPGRPRKEHCRSRRAQHLWISFLDFGSPPRLGFMLSPPPPPFPFMLCHPITAEGRSLSTQQGRRVGRHFFHWPCGSRLRVRQLLRPGMLAAS